MSILDEFERSDIEEFPGADLRSDAKKRIGAVLSENVEFDTGDVLTRRGFARYLTSGDLNLSSTDFIRTLFDWLEASWHRLVYYVPHATNGGKWLSRNFNLSTTSSVASSLSITGVKGSAAVYGSRIFFTAYKSDLSGADAGRVWNGLFSPGPVVDTLFQSPIPHSDFDATPIAFTEPSAGTVTPGTHRFGIVWITRNGYETAPTYTPTSSFEFTAAGDKNAKLEFTPDSSWPSWVRAAKLVLTAVSDLSTYYFVAGSETNVAGGTSTPFSFTFDIDDPTLVQGTNATDWFNRTNTISNPKRIFVYRRRMVYLADIPDAEVLDDVSGVWISDPDDPQVITADRSLIYLPGRRQVISHFVLHGLLFLLGPSWTYVLNDSGADPIDWGDPELVDGRVGTLAPEGAVANPARGIAWVAAEDGLYLFRGDSYPHIPVSYYQQADWDRINWSGAGYHVEVQDYSDQQQIKVLVPLDSATEPSHIMTWDYSQGFDIKDLAKSYSLDKLQGIIPTASQTTIHPDNMQKEYWVAGHTGAADASKVYRQKSAGAGDSSIYNDDGNGFNSKYITRMLPKKVSQSEPIRHHGGRFRVTGSGPLLLKAHSMDRNRSAEMAPIYLNGSPGEEYFRTPGSNGLQSEGCHIEVSNGGVANNWFRLSWLRWYFTKWVGQR